MKVAMMQPTFLPWQGFFELIWACDRFVVADDYQFSAASYHQRNRLFLGSGQVGWYTVPVRRCPIETPLNHAQIANRTPWRRTMWEQIRHTYARAQFFGAVGNQVKKWLLTPEPSLAAQNIGFIRLACELMGFRREFRLSSSHPSRLRRSHRALDLLRWCEADWYLSAHGAFAYMSSDGVFPVPDIEAVFQDFKPKPYPQTCATGQFVPFLSILDALMNVGPAGTLELVSQGTERWLTWEEMVARSRSHQPEARPEDELS